MTKPQPELTDDDLRKYLELTLAEKITVEQAKEFMDGLSKDQQARLDAIIDEMAKPHEPTAEEIAVAQRNEDLLREQNKAPSAVLGCDPTAQQQGFCWRQPIEYYRWGYIEGQSQAWNQRYTTICDNDSSDTNLVVYFNISSNDPDRLRWSTTSSGVYTVTSSSQNGFDFDNWGVHLCMENRLNNFYTDAQIATSLLIWRVQ